MLCLLFRYSYSYTYFQIYSNHSQARWYLLYQLFLQYALPNFFATYACFFVLNFIASASFSYISGL